MVRVVCLGEARIEYVAQASSVSAADATGFLEDPGGASGCVALGLAGTLARNRVDIGSLRFNRTARDALAFGVLAEDGERGFRSHRHPSADPRPEPKGQVSLRARVRPPSTSARSRAPPSRPGTPPRRPRGAPGRGCPRLGGPDSAPPMWSGLARVCRPIRKALVPGGARPENLSEPDEERIRRAPRFACATGALATTREGAIPALPIRQELLALLGGG